MTVYRPIIKKAWEITRKYKFLWFFGLFAALLGNGGEIEIIYENFQRLSNQPETMSALKDLYVAGRFEEIISQATQYFSTNTPVAIAYAILVVLLFILILWLIVISQSALINKVYKINKGQESKFDDGMRVGKKFFWPVLSVNIISRAVIYGLFLAICGPLLYLYFQNAETGYVIAYMLISFIIFVPLGIIIAFITKYATAYVVIKEMSVWSSIKKGWVLFVRNWLISIEMAIILLAINVIVGLGFLVLVSLLALPFLLLSFIFGAAAGTIGSYLIIVPAAILFFAVLFIVGAAFSTFQFSSWTQLFLRLNEGKVISKIARLFSSSGGK
ncbi:MAG: hypothetical protein ABIB97_03700 [Patescibacteria group bacterium]